MYMSHHLLVILGANLGYPLLREEVESGLKPCERAVPRGLDDRVGLGCDNLAVRGGRTRFNELQIYT